MPHQGIAFHDRANILSLGCQGCRTTEHLWDASFRQVRCRRHKQRALRKGGQVLVRLDPRQIEHRIGLLATHQLENPRVRADEKLALHLHNPVGMVGRFHRIDPDDVHRAFGKGILGRLKHKRGMHRVKLSDIVRQINDLGLRHPLENAAFE